MTKVSGWTSLWIVLAVFTIVSCGGDDYSKPAPTPELTGLWYGTYTSEIRTVSVDVDITFRNGQSFSGIWKYSSSENWSTYDVVDVYTYPGTEGRTIVIFDITSGSYKPCCDRFGCWSMPSVEITLTTYYDNGVARGYAEYIWICGNTEVGFMTLTHQSSP